MCRKREGNLNQTDSNTLKEADDIVGFLRLGTHGSVLNVLIALTPRMAAASKRKGLASAFRIIFYCSILTECRLRSLRKRIVRSCVGSGLTESFDTIGEDNQVRHQ